MAMQQHDASQAPPTGVSRRRFLLLIGAGLNAIAAVLLAAPVLGYVFASFGRKGPSQAWISLGPIDTYPENQTRLVSQSVYAAVGRHDGQHPMLGAADHWGAVSGLCGELHASRLPGALVPGLPPVSVSVPRRRLL